jgi:hypothetical protein
MEPNKVETQIQEKLNSREIRPSAQAWDRLDAMLTVAEEKKTKKSPFLSFRFIGIAASFLVFLTIGKFVYNENSNIEIPNSKNQQTIVKSDSEVSGEIPKEAIEISKEKFQIPSSEQLVLSNNKPKSINQKPVEVSIINQNQSNSEAEVIQKQQEIPQPFISQEVVVSNQKNDIAEVEIPIKKETPVAKIKVNATSLLSQVNGELNQLFRESKLEKIARNFNTVKVALANRNKE